MDRTYTRSVEPHADGWRSFAFRGGTFDSAQRPYTKAVSGTICMPDHLVLCTLRGGAERLTVTTDCGHRYVGSDRPGAVSFVPAHCERRLSLSGVQSKWASLALRPELLGEEGPALDFGPFTNVDDPFVASLLGEMERLLTVDGQLDPAYCETLSLALASYLSRRYGRAAPVRPARKLSPWCIRRIDETIEAHIDRPILIDDLAALAGISAGYFHRAFRATTGMTPLEYIQERRIRRAIVLLASERASVAEIALRVGFLSPSHFTRTFRRVTGMIPSHARARTR